MKNFTRNELRRLKKEFTTRKLLVNESDIPAGLSAIQRKFLKCLAESPSNLAEAARKAAVPRKTVYNWQSSNDAFKQACSHVSHSALDIVESKLLSLVLQGNLSAIKFYLNTH